MFLTAQKQTVQLKGKLFRGFADPSRLSILEELCAGPRSVSQIMAATGLSQSNLSNHLSCLRDCGLVIANQQGRQVFYQLSDPRVAGLLAMADELLAEVARGVYNCTRFGASGNNDHSNQNGSTD